MPSSLQTMDPFKKYDFCYFSPIFTSIWRKILQLLVAAVTKTKIRRHRLWLGSVKKAWPSPSSPIFTSILQTKFNFLKLNLNILFFELGFPKIKDYFWKKLFKGDPWSQAVIGKYKKTSTLKDWRLDCEARVTRGKNR